MERVPRVHRRRGGAPDSYIMECDGTTGVEVVGRRQIAMEKVRRVHRRRGGGPTPDRYGEGATGPPASEWCAGQLYYGVRRATGVEVVGRRQIAMEKVRRVHRRRGGAPALDRYGEGATGPPASKWCAGAR
ncbi:hypothetical protein RB195_008154 [Necator americanus]|uniref:Uncharacterized protein n=1 Tax=Necator americanus TaxID=51031 RepID=A0ABR1CN31_NECAM